MSGKRQWPYVWQEIEGLGEVLTRGSCGGLPVLAWGWAPRELFATRRQLRAAGLCPGGRGPVVCLHFAHHRPARSLEHAQLYYLPHAAPKRTATPAQLAAVEAATRARRVCRKCGREERGMSTISHLCSGCETATDFWATHAREHGHPWPAAA